MTPVQPVRGTQSLLGEDADRLAAVVAAFDRVRSLFGFRRVEVPVIEQTPVFARTLGETSDVVSKEMYTFLDKRQRSITLRPEFTAGIARAYLSEGWQRFIPLRVASYGPVFRYEAPQAGRYRQFHQLDAEIIGAAEPQADVELLAFAYELLRELRIEKSVRLELNTLGDSTSRNRWSSANAQFFGVHAGDLSPESQARLQKNVLRILDSKDERDREIIKGAPEVGSFLTPEARTFYEQVKDGLQFRGIPFVENPRLVRGLDYYRHTAFEFITDQLGAQGAVIAGGRYDGLIESLGGSHTPAVGWAAGIERLSMLIEAPPSDAAELVLIPDSEDDEDAAVQLLRVLRAEGIRAEMAFSGSSKKRYERAKKGDALRALTVTSADVDGFAMVRIRDLRSGAPPVRRRLRDALKRHFTVREDEHRAFWLDVKA
jgi:histidyl-tRNA synthetase